MEMKEMYLPQGAEEPGHPIKGRLPTRTILSYIAIGLLVGIVFGVLELGIAQLLYARSLGNVAYEFGWSFVIIIGALMGSRIGFFAGLFVAIVSFLFRSNRWFVQRSLHQMGAVVGGLFGLVYPCILPPYINFFICAFIGFNMAKMILWLEEFRAWWMSGYYGQ